MHPQVHWLYAKMQHCLIAITQMDREADRDRHDIPDSPFPRKN
jgi:hypothetical protein